jgi:hypothetical protein
MRARMAALPMLAAVLLVTACGGSPGASHQPPGHRPAASAAAALTGSVPGYANDCVLIGGRWYVWNEGPAPDRPRPRRESQGDSLRKRPGGQLASGPLPRRGLGDCQVAGRTAGTTVAPLDSRKLPLNHACPEDSADPPDIEEMPAGAGWVVHDVPLKCATEHTPLT